jgi:hypothetical protein
MMITTDSCPATGRSPSSLLAQLPLQLAFPRGSPPGDRSVGRSVGRFARGGEAPKPRQPCRGESVSLPGMANGGRHYTASAERLRRAGRRMERRMRGAMEKWCNGELKLATAG